MLNLATPYPDDDESEGAKADNSIDSLKNSVQDTPKVDTKSGVVESSFWGWNTQRGPILPAWGTRQRELWLRWYDRYEFNTLWQGASAGLTKKIKATSYELKGGRNLTNRFDGVLRDAQFGAGWGVFLSLFLRDYLRFDGGAYAEIIAPGNPLRPPTGAVTGIAHLDSFRCLPTGDPEYPVVYYSRLGKIHVMHHTRILHLIDQPDGDQDHPGYGLCSLSRAIAVVQRQLLVSQYIASSLDDKPAPGVLIANNISAQDRDKVFAMFRGEQSNDLVPEWGKVAWFFNIDPAKVASITPVNFSAPPINFDYPVYVNVDVNELALAIGLDKQELWELSGATGTAGQSIVQAEKSEGKAPGEIRASLEREINNKLLPDSLEFQWKVKDGRAAQQDAQTAQLWAGVATTLAPLIGNQKAAEIAANQVEALADVLFDENGQMIRLPDNDQKQPGEQDQNITAQDAAPNSSTNTGTPTTAQDSTPNATKDYEDTRSAFVLNLIDLVHAGQAEDLTRRRAGIVMRAQLNSSGKQARIDGLEKGGVEDGLSDDDLVNHTVWLATQSAFVTPFLNDVFQNGLTDKEVDAHAEAWANKSLQDAYYGGLQSADANGLYKFTGQDGLESCLQCKSLKGQVHRMKDWARKKLRPGVDTDSFDCGGYQCNHGLEKTSGKAYGTWLN